MQREVLVAATVLPLGGGLLQQAEWCIVPKPGKMVSLNLILVCWLNAGPASQTTYHRYTWHRFDTNTVVTNNNGAT